MNQTTNNELMDSLATLEMSLETPVVPGESETWLQQVEQVFGKVEAAFQDRQADHRRQFTEIADTDAGLLRRVEQMKEQDQVLVGQFADFRQLLSTQSQFAASGELEAGRTGPSLEKISALGLALVIAVRKQELAIATWLSEALERDRGVVD